MLSDIVSFLSNATTLLVLLGYAAALWAALIIWTFFDIKKRTDNVLYQVASAVLVLTAGLLGFAIYLILRPSGTKEEIAIRLFEEKILEISSQVNVCPKCNEVINERSLFCPNCAASLKDECSSCQKQLNFSWNACPYCGTKKVKLKEERIKEVLLPEVLLQTASVEEKPALPKINFFSQLSNTIKKQIVERKAQYAKLFEDEATVRKTARKRKRKVKREPC